ncbi:MAG TPA: PQQ-dependent sugar dehydrogenase [bacterium]|nr:PQQ-dependent sugar dehydrogenase [bacterium]
MNNTRLLLLAAIFAFAFGGSASTAAPLVPSGFTTQALVGEPFTGEPVGFAFLPDGRILLIERPTGVVRLALPGSSTSTAIATIPGVEAVHPERGLLAIAVDPDWPARPYLYFYYNHSSEKIFLTMYTASGDLANNQSLQLSLATPFHLLTDIPDVNGIHNGGSLRFGPDGMLYVSVGDDGQSCPAQDLSSLLGSILRLDISAMPGVGGGPPSKSAITPPDNPFSGPNDNARLHFAWGLRNPFRFTIDSLSGDLTIGDVGSSFWEEINHLDLPGEAGANFGWPQMEGNQEIFCCGDCGDGNTFTAPVAVMQHPVGIIAIIGGPVIRGNLQSATSFPPSYEGNIFFFELYSGVLRRLVEVGGGTWQPAAPVAGQPDSLNWGTGHFGACDAQMGSDGALYYVSLGLSGVARGLYRIAGQGATGSPNDAKAGAMICTASPNPMRAAQGVMFTLNPAPREPVRIAIQNVAGRIVRTLSGRGAAQAHWDARDESGRWVAPGIYLWSITVQGELSASGKITILR